MLAGHAQASLVGLWEMESTSVVAGQTLTANSAADGVAGVITGSAGIVADVDRGNVIEFDGASWVDGGFVNALTTTEDFTWSFWAKQDAAQAINNDVIINNRFGAGSTWIKFTPNAFEYRPGTGSSDINYANISSADGWDNHAVVKDGTTLTYYRNGVVAGTNTVTSNLAQLTPFFMGGDAGGEQWQGRLDDVAIFSEALSGAQITAVMGGDFSAYSLAGGPKALNDEFNGSSVDSTKWNVINKGLESTVDGGYAAPTVSGGVLTISGTTSHSFWSGKTLQSVDSYSSDETVTFSVDRLSLAGTGTAYRSSIWMWADDSHYLHFSQNIGENGWSYNWNDVGGLGGVPTGSGVNIASLNPLDGDLGLFNMKLVYNPLGGTNARIDMYLDNILVASQNFTNWSPADFQVMITGQARANGDTLVHAVFDNAMVSTPEPSTLVLLGLGALPLLRRRSASN